MYHLLSQTWILTCLVNVYAIFCFIPFLLDKPGPPAGLINFNSVAADRIVFSWEPVPVSDQGGSKVTHYIVERRETSRVVWSTVSDKHEQTHISVGKLLCGNEYVFRVMAVNKFGIGEPLESEPIIAKNAFGKFHAVEWHVVFSQLASGSLILHLNFFMIQDF